MQESDSNQRTEAPITTSRKIALFGLAAFLLLGFFLLTANHAVAASDNVRENADTAENRLHEFSLVLIGNSIITNVRIFLKREVPRPEISVDSLGSEPPGKIKAPSTARSFFEITTNLEENYKIVRSVIRFKVSKAWIEGRGVSENSIRLMRLNEGWHELPTRLVDETDVFLFFESETQGFSTFALSAEGNPPEETHYLLYTAVGIGAVGAGLSFLYWFKNRRIEPFTSLESVEERVLGREKPGPPKGLGKKKVGIELKPEGAREEARKKRAELIEELKRAAKENDRI